MPDQDEFDNLEGDDSNEEPNDNEDARFWQELNDLDWSSEEEDEIKAEMRAREQRLGKLPLMQKAKEILHLTEALVATIEEKSDIFQICPRMIESAMQLGAKVVRAEASGHYSPKMESAVVVKLNAVELLAQLSLCEAEELVSPVDAALLRQEVDEFRHLFLVWVAGFDRTNDLPDEWGLFSQPS
jgi:hypothetical protein